jgi:hypothetical protein
LTVLTILTLANSNSALPEDGDYTETCWSCFNVIFNTPFKKTCASVGVKTLKILYELKYKRKQQLEKYTKVLTNSLILYFIYRYLSYGFVLNIKLKID